jgi:protein gp37
MAQNSEIEWTEVTWNPVTGCSRISSGCQHCYAERIAYRFAGMYGYPERPNHFDVKLRPERLGQPLRWKKPRVVFVNSMSDLFHEKVPFSFIQEVLTVMRTASEHTFQVLTKRSRRLLDLNEQIDWPANVWMGVTVENEDCLFRVDHLRHTDASIKFISFEPLLGPIDRLDLDGLDWVIVGGESGPKCRPLRKEWIMYIKQRCEEASVPFFFKQWGGVRRKQAGRELEGRTWDAMPLQKG